MEDHSQDVGGRYKGTLIQRTYFQNGDKQSQLIIHHDSSGNRVGDIQETQFDRSGRRTREIVGRSVRKIGDSMAVVENLRETSFDPEGRRTVEREGNGDVNATGQRFFIGSVVETHFHPNGCRMFKMECDYQRNDTGLPERRGPVQVTYYEPNGEIRGTQTGTIATSPDGRQFFHYDRPGTTPT